MDIQKVFYSVSVRKIWRGTCFWLVKSLIPIQIRYCWGYFGRRKQISLKHIGIAALTVDGPTVEKHVVEQISHWFTANTTLRRGEKKFNIHFHYSMLLYIIKYSRIVYPKLDKMHPAYCTTQIREVSGKNSPLCERILLLTLKQCGWQDMFRCSMVILASFPTSSPQYVQGVTSLLKTKWGH